MLGKNTKQLRCSLWYPTTGVRLKCNLRLKGWKKKKEEKRQNSVVISCCAGKDIFFRGHKMGNEETDKKWMRGINTRTRRISTDTLYNNLRCKEARFIFRRGFSLHLGKLGGTSWSAGEKKLFKIKVTWITSRSMYRKFREMELLPR